MTPNLFLIGAPKCGTSSLYNWLSAHPEIAGSRVKEPFLLMDEGHPLLPEASVHTAGLSVYDQLFDADAAQASVRMEGSTHYLFQDTPRIEIAGLQDAKAVVVLREPAERAYSSFTFTAHNLARLKEDLTFADYVDLVDRGEALYPRWCDHPANAYVLERDIEYGRYWRYLAPWRDALGPERLRVILFEEMRERPSETVKTLVAWLGLNPDLVPADAFEARNKTVQVRNKGVHRLASWINRSIRPPASVRGAMKRVYASVQYQAGSARSDGDIAAIDALRVRYRQDNATLAEALDLDLAAWDRRAAPQRQAVD